MSTKVLVAIANYGEGNRNYLQHLIDEYRKMPINCDIVILSDRPKDFDSGVEVLVGLPTSNPWSLPFSHRKLFRQKLDEYDWFIYSEDDTLMTWPSLKACMSANDVLLDSEIPGFMRKEIGPDGQIFFSTCHSHFRWIPGSVRERGGELWAYYTNEHSACFVISRKQLKKAIDSGGFSIEPHEGRYDMLCTASTDIYTRCGMERIICLDRISEFTLHHLPNKYVGKMGLPANEMAWQLEALKRIHAGELPKEEMLNPESNYPFGYGSKKLREEPDPILLDIIKSLKGYLLVWGAGDGYLEQSFLDSSRKVGVVALNSVMAQCCSHRGLEVIGMGSLRSLTSDIKADTLVTVDILQLVSSPVECLAQLRNWLKLKGVLIIRVPNFRDIRMMKRRWEKPGFRLPLTKEATGVNAFTCNQLISMLHQTGFNHVEIKQIVKGRFYHLNQITLGLLASKLVPFYYVVAKKC
ncbi:MAG: class I SAM-dependent methyltransferase [Thermoproteota archaeon]